MASLAILLLLARFSGSMAISSDSNYSISRNSEQQVIATVAPVIIPDADGQSAQPFLTSPTWSYAAYLRRAPDVAGGLGGDACYVQIQKAGGDSSAWESDCTPVGGADACDLAFSPVGLELLAAGHSLWDTGLDAAADPETLSLDDKGDMSIVTKAGVTVWKASGEPWAGQQCGAPVPASKSPSMQALLPPPTTTSAKIVTPPAVTLAGTGTGDSSFGGLLAPPPQVDTVPVPAPDLPVQPPVDTVPEQPLTPPPADASTNPSLPTPAAYTPPDSPDLPLAPSPPEADVSPDHPLAPPPADMSPDLPLYSSPPPAPTAFGPPTALPPFGVPFAPPGGAGETSPDATAPPHGEPGSPGGVPHKQGPLNHDLPTGASPPLPDTLGPSGHGEGASGPLGHGQPQQGVFGQDPPLVDSEGHPLPLEDSAAGWSRREHGRVAVGVVLTALIALCFGF